jgi:P-type E1-E2 ATPase
MIKRLGWKLGGFGGVDRASAVARKIAHTPDTAESNVNFALTRSPSGYDRPATTAETIIPAGSTAGDRAIVTRQAVYRRWAVAAIVAAWMQFKKLRIENLKLCVAIAIWLLLIIGSLPMSFNLNLAGIPGWLQQPLWQLMLLTPVQFWCGRSFLLSAGNATRQRRINLHTLIVVGTLATYLFTFIGIITPQLLSQSPQLPSALYADLAAGAIALMLLAETLEQQIKGAPKLGISKLIKLAPDIHRIVENRLADRFSRRFVPIVILIAIVNSSLWLSLTGNLSIAFTTGLGILIIVCPSALGLAAAVAIRAGIRQGRKWGISIHNGASLELLQQTNIIVLDRTGVLTVGKPVFTDFIPVVDKYHGNELEILQLVASLEAHTEHPLATAIVDRAIARQIPLKSVSQFQSIEASGVQGVIDNKLIQVGSSEWIISLNIYTVLQATNHQILTNYQQEWEADGKTVIWIAIDSEIAGIISISDPVKSNAIAIISKLKKLGLQIVLLTEDNLHAAYKLAQNLGINEHSHVFAQIQPEDKVEVVRELQSRSIGNRRAIVAMVGKNINNAAALAQADVGIVIGTEIDSELFTSDITIIEPNLLTLLNTIRLSRSTVNIIKQNICLITLYHLLSIPIASGLFNSNFTSSIASALPICLTILSAGSILLNTARFSRSKSQKLGHPGTDRSSRHASAIADSEILFVNNDRLIDR